jgi:hypothetical protein
MTIYQQILTKIDEDFLNTLHIYVSGERGQFDNTFYALRGVMGSM